VRCKTCHYSLEGLAGREPPQSGAPHRCPECGRAFDANDPDTFVTEADLRALRKAWVRIVWAAILNAAFATGLALATRNPVLLLFILPPLIPFIMHWWSRPRL
jgi:hypothetical protein